MAPTDSKTWAISADDIDGIGAIPWVQINLGVA